MLCQLEAALGGNTLLTLFNLFVKKLFNQAAIHAHQMIMVRPEIQLKYRLA
jgi:hypothetical protein